MKRYHGIDKHSTHLTIDILNENGEPVKKIARCTNFREYIESLTPDDAVTLETGNQSFHLAIEMMKQGAHVIVTDAREFSKRNKSPKKTDKNDARDLAYALYDHFNSKSDKARLHAVYVPPKEIRELRRLFSAWNGINKSIVQFKNSIIGMLRDSGVDNSAIDRSELFNKKTYITYIESLNLSQADYIAIEAQLDVLILMVERKEKLKSQIVWIGRFLEKEVKLLISVRGISPFMALAFLADIGDINRFKGIRNLNAYLGLVPTTYSSGKRTYQGKIIKQSRHLTRTLFTQSVQHIGKSSVKLSAWYQNVRDRRGIGKGRIALIRQIIKILRRMLLDQEVYRFVEQEKYAEKLTKYRRILQKDESFLKSA
jgi:transposase